jgi:hypothetical protein
MLEVVCLYAWQPETYVLSPVQMAQCWLPGLQARLNAGTVTVHEPVVFAVSGCPTGTCRTGVLHSSGHAQSPSSGESAGSGEVPGSRGGATPVNVADPVNGESGGGVDGTGAAGPVGATEKAAACGMRLKTVLQVNLQAGPNGRIDIKTRSWMDGLRARMRERDQS